MLQRLRQFSPRQSRFNIQTLSLWGKLAVLGSLTVAGIIAQQDVTNYLTPGVSRVGERLSCRCGGCKESVGKCPMLRCDSADPKRRRIFEMQGRGMSDDAIVNTFVKEEGPIALSSPLPLHLITWLATPIAALLGFWIYVRFVKKNQRAQEVLTADDHAMINRYRAQMDRELDDSSGAGRHGA